MPYLSLSHIAKPRQSVSDSNHSASFVTWSSRLNLGIVIRSEVPHCTVQFHSNLHSYFIYYIGFLQIKLRNLHIISDPPTVSHVLTSIYYIRNGQKIKIPLGIFLSNISTEWLFCYIPFGAFKFRVSVKIIFYALF